MIEKRPSKKLVGNKRESATHEIVVRTLENPALLNGGAQHFRKKESEKFKKGEGVWGRVRLAEAGKNVIAIY